VNSRGKKVLDIEWERKGVKVKIPVKAFEKMNYETDKKEMIFRAEYPDAGIDVSSTDINVIRNEIIEKLDHWYTIRWELFFLVTIDGGLSGQAKAKFDVEYDVEFYVVGKDSMGKTRHMRIPRPEPDMIRNFDGKPTQWGGEQPQEGEPETGVDLRKKADSGRYYLGNRNKLTKALVKATPETVQAADQFIEALRCLLDRMHHHFAPERIEALLQNTALLLPAPKGGGK
jgi:hypothetical protein